MVLYLTLRLYTIVYKFINSDVYQMAFRNSHPPLYALSKENFSRKNYYSIHQLYFVARCCKGKSLRNGI